MEVSGRINLMSILADTSLIFLISLCFPGKWKIVTLLFPIVLAAVAFANVLYFRFFGDIIPASMYFSSIVFNNATLGGAALAYSWTDFLLFFIALLPTAYILIMRKSGVIKANTGWKTFLVDGVLLIISWVYMARYWYEIESEYYPGLSFMEVNAKLNEEKEEKWSFFYKHYNFTGYLIKCLYEAGSLHKNLSAEDKEFISNHLRSRYAALRGEFGTPPDNLIMIVVESLPNKLLESEKMPKLAPVLTGILESDSTLYLACQDLTGYGSSSDAQLMYNTGLLPLRNEAFVLNYGLNDFPALAKALGKQSVEMIGEEAMLWRHNDTSLSYGFERLIDGIAPWNVMNQDSLIFRRAAEQLREMKSPFFLFLSTLSMHVAYKEQKVPRYFQASDLETGSPEELEYYNRVHHFDRQLGIFLDELKRQGKYYNSLIVIIGDHNIPERGGIKGLDDGHVPLIILNSPRMETGDFPFTQADVFPTILDLMNVRYEFKGIPYSGLGSSIFSTDHHAPSEADYEVSELLIKGFY